MEYNVNDIADYIILKVKSEDDNASLINLKLQKLLYYVQAWSYGINGKPLFKGDFQAWIHGPVNKDIYDRFNKSKYLYSEILISDVINFNLCIEAKDSEFIDFILENYMKFSGAELERLSHSELPWIKSRGNLRPFERCDTVISPEVMKEFYGSKWTEINK